MLKLLSLLVLLFIQFFSFLTLKPESNGLFFFLWWNSMSSKMLSHFKIKVLKKKENTNKEVTKITTPHTDHYPWGNFKIKLSINLIPVSNE